LTNYSAQGKTAERVLVSSTADRTVSQESFYVAVSRAKYDLQIFAQSREFLLEQAQQSNAQETVLELLQPQSKQQVVPEPMVTATGAANSVALVATKPAKPEASPPTLNKKAQPTTVNKTVTPLGFAKPANKVQVRSSIAHAVKRLRPSLPKKVKPFWIPASVPQPPQHIDEKHWRELVEGSAIHPALAAANFRSLQMDTVEQEHSAWEYLMYSTKLERSNTGRLSLGMLQRYFHIEAGGWWCSAGVNALSFPDLQPGDRPQENIWGCYKPNTPRENPDKPGKVIKYEHPPKTDLSIFLLDVPNEIANRIYEKNGVSPSDSDRASGFWYCVWKYNLPVTLTEGAKKAACLLSQGHAAIGLPGIYAGYRSKDEQGNPIKAHLHEELAVFATPGREIYICFDYETRPEPKRNLEIAISRTGSLLQRQGSKVSVVNLPGPDKGVDDLIVTQGPLAYERQHRAALRLNEWRQQSRQQWQLAVESPKNLSVEQRKERLKDKLARQQPVEQQDFNKPQEQTDGYPQQSRPECAVDSQESSDERYNWSERKDRTLRSQSYQTQPEDRAIGEQPRPTERTNHPIRSHSDREFERTESESPELLEAISRYFELQEVEQLGADIAELNRSLTDGWLRSQGAAEFSGAVERQNPASLDSAAGDGSVKRQGGDLKQRGDVEPPAENAQQRAATEQLLKAIAGYLEVAAIESTPVMEALQSVTGQLEQYQHTIANGSTILSNLESLLVTQQTYNQVLQAIVGYVQQQEVQAALTPQVLQTLTEQINQLQETTKPIGQINAVVAGDLEPDSQPTAQIALEAFASYVEQAAVESAINPQILQTLTDQLSQLHTQELTTAIQQLEAIVTDYQAQLQAQALIQAVNPIAEAIANQREHTAIGTPEFVQDLERLVQELTLLGESQLPEQLQQLQSVIEHYHQQLEAQQAMSQTTIRFFTHHKYPWS
jgi:hypothetical protein